jgi:hypothetical protein
MIFRIFEKCFVFIKVLAELRIRIRKDPYLFDLIRIRSQVLKLNLNFKSSGTWLLIP